MDLNLPHRVAAEPVEAAGGRLTALLPHSNGHTEPGHCQQLLAEKEPSPLSADRDMPLGPTAHSSDMSRPSASEKDAELQAGHPQQAASAQLHPRGSCDAEAAEAPSGEDIEMLNQQGTLASVAEEGVACQNGSIVSSNPTLDGSNRQNGNANDAPRCFFSSSAHF